MLALLPVPALRQHRLGKEHAVRLIAKIVGGLVALVLLCVVAIYAITSIKLGKTFAFADSAVPPIPTDSASIARGAHFVQAHGKCAECHGESLGGKDFLNAGPFAHIYGPNLTSGSGGVLKRYTDVQVVNAIRHGTRPDGRSLLIMPSEGFQDISADDLGALLAYLKSLPPVDNETPPPVVGPIGRALLAFGKLPIQVAALTRGDAQAPAAVPPGVTPEYGKYLARVGGCEGCHGTTLAGGKIEGGPPDAKPAANLTPTGIGKYTEEDFFRALREGKRPDGSAIDPFMPVAYTKHMTDDEIRAVFAFLKTVTPREFGAR
jgi:cytochrome c553